MTGKEMCEKIAAELKRKNGVDVDPKTIWEMSPTGELGPVIELYYEFFPDERPASPDGSKADG